MTTPSVTQEKYERVRITHQLSNSYKMLNQVMISTEVALNAYTTFPGLPELVNELRELDHGLKELLIAQSSKGIPVNIGAEVPYLSDTFDTSDSSHGMVRRTQAKKIARSLYRLHHPDKGGDAAMFNTIKRAADAGDLEVLAYFRVRDGVESYTYQELKTLTEKITARYQKYRGRPSFQVAALFYSNQEEYVIKFKALIQKRIDEVKTQMAMYLYNQGLAEENKLPEVQDD